MASELSISRVPHPHVTSERCPWCDQPIPHERSDEIRARIQERERERSAAQEKLLRERFVEEKAASEAKSKAETERVRKDAAAALAQAKAESMKREAEACEDAKTQAEAVVMVKVIAAEAAKKAAEEKLEVVKAERDERLQKELSQLRELLERGKTEAVQKEQAKAFEERQKLEKKLEEMQRQLQNNTAQELGEGAEVDLFETLRGAFKDDRIKRIDKGVAGADICHEVVYNGESCGRIVYDSKNHKAWRSEFVTKLREDQLAAKAEHAVLATRVFPAGKNQLDVQDGVLIANPARAVTVVTMLREHIIQAYRLRLGGRERDEKTAALYEFINSERCNQLFEHFDTLTQDMLDLEIAEKKSHDNTWKKRGLLIRNVQKVIQGQLHFEIEQIIEGGG
ncbi:MAG: DUF2130 domain-containing protein [Gammaproteobacteria bacterium]